MNPSGITVVIGLGEIGKPLFDHIHKAHPSARGVDITPVEIQEPVGIMHVCVPFTLDNGFVDIAVGYAKKYKPQVVVINSTVVPGTTQAVETKSGIPAVYSPVRGKHVRMFEDLARYKKFVGGSKSDAVALVTQHFASIGMQTETLPNAETVELAKLCETTYFGLLIGWAQTMDRFAKEAGADYQSLHKFFAEVDYLPKHAFAPGFIGGHCVMPNIALLKSRFEAPLLDGLVASNEEKARELGQNAVEAAHGKDRPRVEPKKIS